MELLAVLPSNQFIVFVDMRLTKPYIRCKRRRRKAWRAARSLVSSPAVCFLPPQDYNGWDIKVLGQAECEARKMGAYLAVGQGSKDGPEFIHLSYKPKGGAWPAMLACMPSHFF